MGIWEVIQKEIVDKPEISAELRTSWREQESMVLTLENTKTKQKTETVIPVEIPTEVTYENRNGI